MPAQAAPRHACIVCNVGTLPDPDSVGFSFPAYKDPVAGQERGDGICPSHALEDLVEAHGGDHAAYRAALLNAGFIIHPRNWLRLVNPPPPPGATCTRKVYPAGSFGAFHSYTCGRKAKVMTTGQLPQPRCGIHDPARRAAFEAQRKAAADAKMAAMVEVNKRRDAARLEAALYADMLLLLKESKGRCTADADWNQQRDAILERAADLEA